MSFPNEKPKDASSEAQLNDWGAAERHTPPLRPGRFSALLGNLTKPVETVSPERSRFLPRLAWSGAAVAAVTVGIATMVNGPQQTAMDGEQVAEVSKNSQPQFTGMVTDGRTGEPILADRGDNIAALATPTFTSGYVENRYPLGNHSYGTVPFLVKIQNNGKAFSGKIIVRSQETVGGQRVRTFVYPVTVTGNGTVLQKTVYATLSAKSYSQCTVELETGRRRFTLYTSPINSEAYPRERVVAMLDDRIGVLSIKRQPGVSYTEAIQSQSYYTKPVNAPDRAEGYDAVDSLVLGKGSESMNAAQWDAIREWVKRGGSLVLLGKGHGAQALANPIVQEMNPMTADGRMKPGAEALNLQHTIITPSNNPNKPVAASHNFGLGMVTLLQFDPTTLEFRSRANGMASLWNGMTNRANHKLAAGAVRAMGVQSPWVENSYDRYGNTQFITMQSQPTERNPFLLHLPELRTVTYVFLGYFVLVVPLSFVVLKQTRRMQYAWATGPILAVVFAGGVGLMSLDLYRNPTSRRTAGILTMNAGDNEARFAGFTELYAPHGGSYRMTLPGKDQVFDDESDEWNYYSYQATNNNENPLGSFTTREMGTADSKLDIALPNLSYRRVYHQETIPLGEGVTADLRVDSRGALVGTVTNNTGRVLHNAWVVLRTKQAVNTSNYYQTAYKPRFYQIGDIQPGSKSIELGTTNFYEGYPANLFPFISRSGWSTTSIPVQDRFSISPTAPLLFAQTDGKDFGPQGFGKSVGGDNSVGLLVRLPLLSNVHAVKGGD